MNNKEYWLYLAKVKALESTRRSLLLEIFGSPEEIYKASEGSLRKIRLMEDHHVDQLLLYRKLDFEQEYERIRELGIDFVTVNDKEFPERLKNIPDAPVFLFYKGKLPDNETPAVAVIGSRKCSYYGREVCMSFSKKLVEAGITIISGMAMGVDGFAHRGAIEAGGKTIAVLGCGPDICYPAINRDIYDKLSSVGEDVKNRGRYGGIISEYYPGDAPLQYYFPQRNRIISGLADVLLVVEAGKKSGTLITVDHALEQGKEIFAIPGRIGDSISDGCNNMIKNGAHMATEPEDIIDELRTHYEILLQAEKRKKRRTPKLDDEEKKVYECLSFSPVQIDEISEKTGIPCGRLSALLVRMEINDIIGEAGKNMYIRKG